MDHLLSRDYTNPRSIGRAIFRITSRSPTGSEQVDSHQSRDSHSSLMNTKRLDTSRRFSIGSPLPTCGEAGADSLLWPGEWSQHRVGEAAGITPTRTSPLLATPPAARRDRGLDYCEQELFTLCAGIPANKSGGQRGFTGCPSPVPIHGLSSGLRISRGLPGRHSPSQEHSPLS